MKMGSIFENDMEKIYLVTYLEYTNAFHDTVRSNSEYYTFIHTGKSFLVRESELEVYSKFGKGYDTIKFIGYLPKNTFDKYLVIDKKKEE